MLRNTKDLSIRKEAAICLPCVFYYFHAYQDEYLELDFQDIYSELSQDEDPEIRIVVGKGLHEAVKLLFKGGEDPFFLFEPFQNILKA